MLIPTRSFQPGDSRFAVSMTPGSSRVVPIYDRPFSGDLLHFAAGDQARAFRAFCLYGRSLAGNRDRLAHSSKLKGNRRQSNAFGRRHADTGLFILLEPGILNTHGVGSGQQLGKNKPAVIVRIGRSRLARLRVR